MLRNVGKAQWAIGDIGVEPVLTASDMDPEKLSKYKDEVSGLFTVSPPDYDDLSSSLNTS